MLPKLVPLLLVPLLSAIWLSSAAPVVDEPAIAALPTVPWSWRKIIKFVDNAGQTAVSVKMSYQLIDNLPTVRAEPGAAEPGQFLPAPEPCDNCAPGTRPQPGEAGRVNSLVNTAERLGSATARSLPGQFPWHVSLLYNLHFYSCSGSLLNEDWVLTAGNCAHGFDWLLVRLGSYRPGADEERFQTTVNSSRIVVHPGYRRGNPRDDIALIKLSSPVGTNSYRLPVRLPSLNSFTTTYDNRKAWLSGWGIASKLGTFKSDATLGHVVESILPNQECAKTFGDMITVSTLCTPTTGFTEGCAGDSGAPLVVYEGKGIFVQVGILTFVSAEAGCTKGSPAGYTRITSYLRWIQNTTGIAPGPDV